jgi:LPXTG-site transpeptidase (sortase) family protein
MGRLCAGRPVMFAARRCRGNPATWVSPGHRDTFFRPLRNVQLDDVITVTTFQGEFRYRVVSTKVVSPTDVAVLDSTGGKILTLVTCHPVSCAMSLCLPPLAHPISYR